MKPFFEQKKGETETLDGRFTAYAAVDGTEGAPPELKHVLRKENNIFAAQADCRQQQTMDDFFKSEMGSSLKKGLDQVMQRLKDAGLWNDSGDPEMPLEDKDIVHGMAELIPIMARIVSFENEDEALQQEGDIYYLGRFSDFRSANMCVQAFSLLYQFRYKEQEKSSARRAVEDLLQQIEKKTPARESYKDCGDDLEKKLFGTYIPAILYSKQNNDDHQKAIERFKKFMSGYRFGEDVNEIVSIASKSSMEDAKDLKKIELLLNKIVALCGEDFSRLANIQKALKALPG